MITDIDVIAPILEDHGHRGWFFVPSRFPNIPARRQRIFAARHSLYYGPDEYEGERIVASWAELRAANAGI